MVQYAKMRAGVGLVLVLVAGSSVAAELGALRDTTPRERAAAQTLMMRAKLGLTDEQLPRVRALNEKYAEKMEPIIKGSSGPLVRMREAREIEQQKEEELKGILSRDQFQKFLAAREELREELVRRVEEQRAHDAR
jgi:hypothetical protein